MIPWVNVWDCRIARGQVFVDVRNGGKQSTPFVISLLQPNAPLLPAVLKAGGTALTS